MREKSLDLNRKQQLQTERQATVPHVALIDRQPHFSFVIRVRAKKRNCRQPARRSIVAAVEIFERR